MRACLRNFLRVFLPGLVLSLGCTGCATGDYPRRPNAEEIGHAEGVYGLRDGYRAHVFGLDTKLYVRIGAGPQTELQMVGPDSFASPDGGVFRFQPGWRDNDFKRVSVNYARAPGGHPPRMFSAGLMPGRGVLD
jgi:hypothetical protein